ncbi:serine hydrolase domain-containing protein [Maridesulfovibrio frigidus]|uniref:serine hydrolase domain-containing protein n=1 Tax=Maridesulfovibrio frigidus TaxID=340956 RepID=UPI0004E1C3D7|nr:serine hydrolase domain-containing protein [Maridesulfovibrio frigidus]
MSAIIVFSAISIMGARGCGNSGTDFPADQAKALQASLDQSKADFGFPGGALAVREVGGATWMGATGIATFASNVADVKGTSDKDFFPSFFVSTAWAGSSDFEMRTYLYTRIGSMTKSYTATLILKMVEEGLLRLEDTIDDWMGVGYYPNSDIITIRQLLNMTAGITSYTGTGTFYARYTADSTQEFLPEELVSYARDSATPNNFAPGAGWNYSNTNFVILGLIAEKAGGSSFKELITTKIIEPLGLTDTSVPAGENRAVPLEYISGYKDDSGTWVDATLYSPTIAFSAGNMISTLPNMLQWIESIHEMKLLTEYSTIQMMDFVSMTTGGPLNGGTAGYGLGLSYHKGAIGHAGEINGYKVIVNKYKNHYFAVIVNTDSAAGNAEEVFWRAARVLYPDDNI